jgi:NhaP-type Na+/H+ or K+/H+ antiporter
LAGFPRQPRIIAQLAVGAVVFTTFGVGVVVHWVEPSLPWAACFALGAIVSPPDAVAAKAVIQGLSLPPRMSVLLEGESLNQRRHWAGTLSICRRCCHDGAFGAGQAAASFFGLALGGILAGAAFGWLVTFLLGRLRDPTLSVIASFLAAWAAYIVGEAVHVSGVLTTVACGLVMGWRQHSVLTAATRTQAQARLGSHCIHS